MAILRNKKILLGVTGSIAAYKTCEIVRILRKDGCEVTVMMTRSATQLVGPATFAALTGREVLTDLFPKTPQAGLEHIHLAETLNAIVVAPATANILAKMAQGISDDLLSTTLLVSEVPILVAPAMNFRMWRHEATRKNCRILKQRGVQFVDPGFGLLASLAIGEGRMAEPARVVSRLRELLGTAQDFAGRRVLVTAGPTRESIDPVRFISNRSSGKMGYCLSRAALHRGAEVMLISGPTQLDPPFGCETIFVETADEMSQAVKKFAPAQDLILMAAAVSDFKPSHYTSSKMKNTDQPFSLGFAPTLDILKAIRPHTKAVLIGFALETENGEENARKKLEEKELDGIILNYANQRGGGMDSDENEGYLFLRGIDSAIHFPLQPKEAMAHRILDEVKQFWQKEKTFHPAGT